MVNQILEIQVEFQTKFEINFKILFKWIGFWILIQNSKIYLPFCLYLSKFSAFRQTSYFKKKNPIIS